MDRKIKVLFTDSVIYKCAQKFGISVEDLKLIAAWQNFVYECKIDGNSYILRITHESRRNNELLNAEIDWIKHLAENTVTACCAVPSPNGKYVEEVRDEGNLFFVSMFNKAGGARINGLEKWDSEIIKKCGEITGKMHALSMEYPKTVRKTWRGNEYVLSRNTYIPDEYSDVLENAEKVLSTIKELKEDKETFGLIHGDIHCGNFFVDNGDIILFDFDECAYSWFVDDIAIQLFYYTYVHEDRAERTNHFMENFLKGYQKYKLIDSTALELIPLFLKYRELIVMTGTCRSMDINNLDKYTKCFVERLSLSGNGCKPYVDYDFTL